MAMPWGGVARPYSSLAILRFGASPVQPWIGFGIGLTFSDTIRLGAGIRVVPARVALDEAGHASPEEIGRRLNVDVVLSGSAFTFDGLRLTAMLIDCRAEREIWQEEYLGRETDLSDMVSSVTDGVRQAMAPGLARSNRPHHKFEDWSAFCAYSEARWLQAYGGPRQRTAALFAEVMQRAPQHAPAASGFGVVAASIALETGDDALLARASEAALHALSLDSSLAEARAVQGLALLKEGRVAEAERSLRRAAIADPLCSEAHRWLAMTLRERGRNDEADREISWAESVAASTPQH